MRLRDLQQVLSKFTDGQKGTIISDCPIYIENKGRLFGRGSYDRTSTK
jgi:hypothetical protein